MCNSEAGAPRSIRELLVRGALFTVPLLALFGIFERAVLVGAKHCYVGEMGKVNLVMQHRIDPELAIFGSSNALTDFDAPLIERLTGLHTYNLGLYGTYFEQYQALLREYAETTKRGRYVVIAEGFMTFRPLAALRGPERFVAYASSSSVHQVMDQIDPPLAWRLKYVPLYSLIAANSRFYGSALRGYLTLLGWPPGDNERQGFLPMDLPWNPSPFEDDHGHSERLVQQFADVISLLAGRGLKVVVVVTPIESECQGMIRNFDAHRRRLRALLGDHGVFLDYTQDPIASDTRYFYNCGHLNVDGAVAFSKAFVKDFETAMGGDTRLHRVATTSSFEPDVADSAAPQ